MAPFSASSTWTGSSRAPKPSWESGCTSEKESWQTTPATWPGFFKTARNSQKRAQQPNTPTASNDMYGPRVAKILRIQTSNEHPKSHSAPKLEPGPNETDSPAAIMRRTRLWGGSNPDFAKRETLRHIRYPFCLPCFLLTICFGRSVSFPDCPVANSGNKNRRFLAGPVKRKASWKENQQVREWSRFSCTPPRLLETTL